MFEAINPLFWWGAAAVSAPIIIHLINRLRYRKVRWAAMEFLLKSQKRNRRKLILEQLLLLLMRCALVMMMVVLVVRPTGCLDQAEAGTADWATYHVVLLDDSLSLQDVEDPRNPESATAFTAGTRLIGELARKYSEASSAHYLTVLKLSDLETPEFGKPADQLGGAPPGQQLTADEVRKLKDRLDALRCTFAPLQPLAALQKGAKYFDNIKEGHKYLHVVSDFRRRDWAESDADESCALLATLARANKVQVRLHDMAQPRRTTNLTEIPRAHTNLGITGIAARSRPKGDADGRPRMEQDLPTRIVTPGLPLYLYVTVRNFSDTERAGLQLSVRVDGTERTSRQIDRIPGGEEKLVVFDLSFGPEESLGMKQITASLDDPDRQDHLPPDNVRYTYVELRKEVPVLLVDPELRASDPPPDSYYLMNALTGTIRTGLRPERIHPKELKSDEVVVVDPREGKDTRRKLDQYAVVFLLNLAGVGDGAWDLDPAGLKALENYVKRGGSVVFFLGERTNVVSFNRDFYKKGEGLFPAPLVLRPEANRSDPFIEDAPDENDNYAKMRFLKAGHPAFPFRGDLAKLVTEYISINRYFKVDPSWQPPENVGTLIQLANRKPLAQYVGDAEDLANRVKSSVPDRFAEKVTGYSTKIAEWIQVPEAKRAQKGPLIQAVGGLLNDAALADFWADASRQALHRDLEKFHTTLVTGDPLVLEATIGRGKVQGHVVAFLTPAAPTRIQNKDYAWNNWANEMPFTYVPMVLALHDYLAALSRSASEIETNREIGVASEIRLDKERYMPRVELWYQKEGDPNPTRIDVITAKEEGPDLIALLRPLRGPGHYRLKLNQPGTEGNPETSFVTAKGDPEEWPLTFNVNSRVEGLLTRVSEAELHEKLALGLEKHEELKLARDEALAFVQSRPWFTLNQLEGAAAETTRNRSWSDYWWVLFVFLGLLLIEQALAMVFSHHLEGGVASAPVQASRNRRVVTPRAAEAEVAAR